MTEGALQLAGTALGGAALGAVASKLFDAFVLTPIKSRQERERWLREARRVAFARLASEIVSLGLPSGTCTDPYRFRIVVAEAELLMPQCAYPLVELLRRFVDAVWELTRVDGTTVTVSTGGDTIQPGTPEDAAFWEKCKIETPDPRVNAAKGMYVKTLTDAAWVIVRGLTEVLQDNTLSADTMSLLRDIDLKPPRLHVTG